MRLQENYKSHETLVTGYNIEISVNTVEDTYSNNNKIKDEFLIYYCTVISRVSQLDYDITVGSHVLREPQPSYSPDLAPWDCCQVMNIHSMQISHHSFTSIKKAKKITLKGTNRIFLKDVKLKFCLKCYSFPPLGILTYYY